MLAKVPGTNGQVTFVVDAFLDQFGVGRQAAINEMTIPGLYTNLDSLASELSPEAAVSRVIYRLGRRTEQLKRFIDEMKEGGYLNEDGVVTPEGLEYASGVIVTDMVKTTFGYKKVEKPLLQAARRQNGKRLALIMRKEGIYINPNASILSDDEICRILDVEEIKGDTFFIPAPVAEGQLYSCTDLESGTTGQSTKLRVAFPGGVMFLDSWFKAPGRLENLKRSKFTAPEETEQTQGEEVHANASPSV